LRVPVAAARVAAGGSSAGSPAAAARLLLQQEQEAAAIGQPDRRRGEAQRQKLPARLQQEHEGARQGGRGGHGCACGQCSRQPGWAASEGGSGRCSKQLQPLQPSCLQVQAHEYAATAG